MVRGIIVIGGILFCGLTSKTSAEDYGVAQSYLHSFSNNVTVYTELFALNKDVSLETSVYFKYTVDFVNPSFGDFGEGGREGGEGIKGADKTAQAVAAVSSASSAAGTTSDIRNELMVGFTHQFGNFVGMEMYYDYSKESDYTSNTPTITLKKDLFEKNTTLTLSYSRNIDLVYGRYMDNSEPRNTDNYFFGITQILSPVDLVQLGYSGSRVRGFTSEGTRLVPISPTTAAQCTDKSPGSCEPERFPDFRLRNAVIFGASHYFEGGFMDRSSIKFTYRYYNDDWSIVSNTEELEYNKYLTDQTRVGLDLRYYSQTQAFFVKDVYAVSDQYLSASPQLQKFNSQLAGLMLSHTMKPIPKTSSFSFLSDGSIVGRYEYYTQSNHTTGQTVMLGLKFRF